MSALNPDRWRELSPYLDHALSLSHAERASWLTALRAQNPDLADLLEKLLEEHGALAQEHFLECRPLGPGQEPVVSGQTLGAYKLISRIGEGGMGNVWLAERADGRFERQVAVKFLRFSLASEGATERFKREGRILGQLAHSHIAELIDAGVTAQGEPYLVLEYVHGKEIDVYCDEQRLGVDARIQLFLDVLAAVSHAHANLVVHRDIKPSNVLVSSHGDVKLLDFGIAKLLADDPTSPAATLLTLGPGAAMTPLFAAPEQLSGGAITTATDVYALGVLFYLLLTGQHPAGRGPHSPADLVKAITETEPRRPSEVVASVESAAEHRAGSPERLRRQLRGDLDTIVAQALKKNPPERYPSVMALADDLQRYLKHQPISARPDTVAYRSAKFVRRNRLAVALSALALLAVMAGITATLQQAHTARRQRDAALRERDRANRIADFMTAIFRVSNPSEKVGNSVTAREILDKASTNIETGLSKDPALQAQMMHVMGRAYMMLGLQRQAQSLFDRSIQVGTLSLGPDNHEVLNAMQDLSWTLFQEGRLADAESLERKLLERDRRVLGPEHPDTLGAMGQLASMLCSEGRCAEAEKLNRAVLEGTKRRLGPEAPDTLSAMDNLSVDLALEGKLTEADTLEQQTLDIQVRVFGFKNLGTISSMINLASIQRDLGKYDQSEKLFRQTLDLEARVLGPDQPEAAQTKYDFAALLVRRGKTDEALSLLRQAIDHGLHPRVDLDLGNDPNFKSLHGDPRFAALLGRAKQRAVSQDPQ